MRSTLSFHSGLPEQKVEHHEFMKILVAAKKDSILVRIDSVVYLPACHNQDFPDAHLIIPE